MMMMMMMMMMIIHGECEGSGVIRVF